MQTSVTPPGITASKVGSIPVEWDAAWFRRFVTNYLQPADIRNTNAGSGVALTPGPTVAAPGTVSLTTQFQDLPNEPYLLAVAPSDAALPNYRLLAAEVGVLTLTDAGAGSTLTAGVAANGITNALLAQAAAHTLKGNSTAGTANVADLTVAQVLSMLGVPAGTDTQIQFNSGGALFASARLTWADSAQTLTVAQSGDSNAVVRAASAAASSGLSGVSLIVSSGAGDGAGTPGQIVLRIGATTAFTVRTDTSFTSRTFTVSTLPTAAVAGQRSFVTDALAPSFGSAVTGGGTVAVPVYVDNTPKWCVG